MVDPKESGKKLKSGDTKFVLSTRSVGVLQFYICSESGFNKDCKIQTSSNSTKARNCLQCLVVKENSQGIEHEKTSEWRYFAKIFEFNS